MLYIDIPHLERLYQTLMQLAEKHADMAHPEIVREYKTWMAGATTMPNLLDWSVFMDDILFSRYEVELRADYNTAGSNGGAWADLVSFVYLADVELSWQVVDHAEKMQDILHRQGFSTTIECSKEEEYQLNISSSNTSITMAVVLGHKTKEVRKYWYSLLDVEGDGNSPLILRPNLDTLSLDWNTFTEQMRYFQFIAPQAIAALYEAFGIEFPDRTLIIDVE